MNTPLHIFSVGTHVAANGLEVDYPPAALAATVAAYDPARHEAPLVKGHPTHDGPAMGWVERVEARDGKLLAYPRQVDPTFREEVRQGRFGKISAAFYLPDSPRNPVSGSYYLRHVGFLGAMPPAVKGLDPPSFADGDEGCVFFMDLIEEKSGMPNPNEEKKAEAGVTGAAEVEKQLAARKAEFAEVEKQLAAREAELALREAALFVDGLVTEGKVLPARKGEVAAFMACLPREGAVEFAEGGQAKSLPPRDWFKAYLASQPKAVHFGEVAAPEARGSGGGYQPPSGFRVDPERAALFAEAEGLAGREKIPFADAVRRLEKR